ncbi:MAG: hypothetical protein LUG99_04475 [Lachnospiraceae bacterium]|nr:hypothetical protein [Lachnospiraceae bacterium]
MKKAGKVFMIIIICVAVLAVALIGFMKLLSAKTEQENKAAMENLRVTLHEGINDLEYAYGQDCKAEIKEYHERVDSDSFSEYVVYYPADLSQNYPVVVWGNGSGGTYQDYEAALKSLASYGFIVIGNDDELTGSGKTIYEMGLYAEKLNTDPDSIFYGKLNTAKMGVGGHSQGACGAVNAATNYERSTELFSSLFTTSMPKIEMCVDLFDYWAYDLSGVDIPYFMTSGTGDFDNSVAPLSSMEENMRALPEDTVAVMARMTGSDHNIVGIPCGYMNAWFCYTLKDDMAAAKAFVGDDAELLTNNLYQDVQIKAE